MLMAGSNTHDTSITDTAIWYSIVAHPRFGLRPAIHFNLCV